MTPVDVNNNMILPDRIFALGGAGKQIAFEILETDWVIRSLLEPQSEPSTVTFTIMDTAEGEENEDKNRIQEIRGNIRNIESDLREEYEGRLGTVDIEYKLITENLHLSGSIDLLGDEAVPRITAGVGMDEEDWWLKESQINENLDFARGVIRKRGLGKAIYYKSYAEDDEISSYVDLPQRGRVAVLVGLGGGTGSGILVDLARHLQQQHRTAEITMFGILPNHTEGIKENTNAFAALSELEHIELNDEGIFKDQVLIPIDPTDFDGKTGNRIQTERYLRELDEAIIYLLLSYYNTQNLEDPFAGSPGYAPFTIGIPQVLRYNVEAINEAREHFRQILTYKEEALEREERIYEEITGFLTSHYGDVESGSGLRDLDRTDLAERLEKFENLLETDLFNELEYHSFDIFSDILSDGLDESDDVMEQIDIISGSLRAVDASGEETGTFVDEIDEHLAEILEKDLTLLSLRKEILEQRRAIDDNKIRDVIEFVLGIGNGTAAPGVKLQQLESKIEDMEDDRSGMNDELESLRTELEETQEEQSSLIQSRVEDYIQNVESDIEDIDRIDVEEVQSMLSNLESELSSYERSIANAESVQEIENIDSSGISDSLTEVNSVLNKSGVDFTERRDDIEASVDDLKEAKEAFILMNQEESLLESLLPWESSTEEEKRDANKDFRVRRNRINERAIFNVGPPAGSFSCDITFDTREHINEVQGTERELRQSVYNSLSQQVDQWPEGLEQEFNSELNTGSIDQRKLREIVEEIFRNDLVNTENLETRIEKLETRLDSIEEDIELYRTTVQLFQDVNNHREVWEDRNSRFRNELSERDESAVHPVSTTEEDYVYVKNVKPDDIFRATGKSDLAGSELFTNDDEIQRLRAYVEELVSNTQNQQYNGLVRRKLSENNSRYSDLKIRTAFMSPAIDSIDPDILDLSDLYREAFDLGASGTRIENPFTSWARDVGGPWDIGLSVFVTGVFLDNIRKVVQADGYQNGYQSRQSNIDDDILIHHSAGLEAGYFVRRSKFLNMENPDDVGFYLRDESDIIEDLKTDHTEMIQTNSDEYTK